ncbi:MAG: J domain-containing protein [Coleofasciculus sp. G3-WIS-01]|uniref:J domain-containing protein n=1 Tax=Coleofasciculus sp. G3-WIS-01 TaxID=3069528 RepID=UPI0032FE4CB6
MSSFNHYQTLDIHPQATAQEIKQAYRRLAKRFHPDSQTETSNVEKIVEINGAYEVLSDPQRRRFYDQQLFNLQFSSKRRTRQQRNEAAQKQYQRQRRRSYNADIHLEDWLQQVYKPVNRLIIPILKSLNTQINQLAADPFDDELIADFQTYLENCRHDLNQAQITFRSQPNPSPVAGVAASLYYCLNQLGDGIDELERFTLNYDEHYLHTGQELFRIATSLRHDAQDAIKHIND